MLLPLSDCRSFYRWSRNAYASTYNSVTCETYTDWRGCHWRYNWYI